MKKKTIETVNEHCKHEDCIYRAHLTGSDSKIEYCDYLCMVGKSRGCKISECDKYVKGKRKLRGINLNGYVVWENEYGQD